MADFTPGPPIPLLPSGLSDPSVPLNEALFAIAVLLGNGAISSTVAAPPGATPQNGDVYLIPPGTNASGSWVGQNGTIAVWDGDAGQWAFYPPWLGRAWFVSGSNSLVRWSGSAWVTISGGGGGGGLSSLAADPNPAFGGNPDFAFFLHQRAGALVQPIGDAATAYVFAGHNAHNFTGSSSRVFSLPASTKAGIYTRIIPLTTNGSMVITPASGASLVSGAMGGVSSLRTAGQYRPVFLMCETNSGGSNALWSASGEVLA